MTKKETLNHFFVSCFNSILDAEEKAIASLTNNTLTIKEIHLIEAVFKAKQVGENCFSTVASLLGVTVGTLTTAFLRLKKKGYLYKEQDKDDKRIYYIYPTSLAEFIYEKHAAFHEHMIDTVLENFPKDKIDTLIEILSEVDTFINNIKEKK